MIDLSRKLKNFGPLELLVISSLAYVIIMLIWTASTRSAVVQKANDIKINHKTVAEFTDNEVNECSSNENGKTAWGENCNSAWTSSNIVKYILDNFKLNNPYKIENLEEGLKNCDYLSLHIPLTEKTKNMINYEKIKSMKKNAVIINTSRGGIINEIDLDKALKNNIIFGAGLDVFEKEPVDKNNPLLKNNKVLLSPHSATFTNECKSRMSLETTKNIIDFFENKLDKSMIVKI